MAAAHPGSPCCVPVSPRRVSQCFPSVPVPPRVSQIPPACPGSSQCILVPSRHILAHLCHVQDQPPSLPSVSQSLPVCVPVPICVPVPHSVSHSPRPVLLPCFGDTPGCAVAFWGCNTMDSPWGGDTAWPMPGDKGCWANTACPGGLQWGLGANPAALQPKVGPGTVGDPLQHIRGDVGLGLGGAAPQVGGQGEH